MLCKKKMWMLFWVGAVLLFSACQKSYTCVNKCTVCTDAHYRISFCSDVLSRPYYQLYIDSLTAPGLGWRCHDTSATKIEQVTGNKEVFLREESGYWCREQK